jgi:ferritin
MDVSKKVNDALNTQINKEFVAEYTYLSMAAYFDGEGLKGFAHWFKQQAAEEKTHGMKIFEYVIARNGNVTLAAIGAPKAAWKSPLEAAQDALKFEQNNTDSINSVLKVADSLQDTATHQFLQWFIQEQVEEEEQATELIMKLKMVGDNKPALMQLDHHLGKRE